MIIIPLFRNAKNFELYSGIWRNFKKNVNTITPTESTLKLVYVYTNSFIYKLIS